MIEATRVTDYKWRYNENSIPTPIVAVPGLRPPAMLV